MDANGKIIPLVEGDQGEGIKDPYEGEDDDPFGKILKKGMRIHFYGYSYKVIAARPNGKITLRFNGIWKGD